MTLGGIIDTVFDAVFNTDITIFIFIAIGIYLFAIVISIIEHVKEAVCARRSEEYYLEQDLIRRTAEKEEQERIDAKMKNGLITSRYVNMYGVPIEDLPIYNSDDSLDENQRNILSKRFKGLIFEPSKLHRYYTI